MNKKYAELDFPAWFDGKDVNEAAFCREFLSKNKLIYADNAFFTPDGRLTDPLLLKEKIYAELECCAAKNIPRTISNIVEIMKLAAHAESFPPKPDEIHVQNGTLRIDGSFLAGRPEIVRSRFPVAYNPQAEKPVVWLRFLSDLLYPEDIPTFQEYIGYCLVPSTKGQRMMILKGEGSEGKSQIGPVLARLFGCNMKDGSIAKISDNRFARADLEHIHLLVDDDMKMEALKQTNYVKSIVTVQGKMRLATMCSTLRPPPIGAALKPWSIGGRNGLSCATRSLRRKVWIVGSTTAAMPVKALNRFLPSTRDRLSAQWKRRAFAPPRATSTAGFAKPTPCCGKQRIKSPLC